MLPSTVIIAEDGSRRVFFRSPGRKSKRQNAHPLRTPHQHGWTPFNSNQLNQSIMFAARRIMTQRVSVRAFSAMPARKSEFYTSNCFLGAPLSSFFFVKREKSCPPYFLLAYCHKDTRRLTHTRHHPRLVHQRVEGLQANSSLRQGRWRCYQTMDQASRSTTTSCWDRRCWVGWLRGRRGWGCLPHHRFCRWGFWGMVRLGGTRGQPPLSAVCFDFNDRLSGPFTKWHCGGAPIQTNDMAFDIVHKWLLNCTISPRWDMFNKLIFHTMLSWKTTFIHTFHKNRTRKTKMKTITIKITTINDFFNLTWRWL